MLFAATGKLELHPNIQNTRDVKISSAFHPFPVHGSQVPFLFYSMNVRRPLISHLYMWRLNTVMYAKPSCFQGTKRMSEHFSYPRCTALVLHSPFLKFDLASHKPTDSFHIIISFLLALLYRTAYKVSQYYSFLSCKLYLYL